ncbi:MAG: DUF2118 domain-containing protein [Chloroflexota bacterium]
MDLVAVHMPKYGMTMEEGIIVEWLVDEGDTVTEGQGIAIIETEKVETELEAPSAGTIVEISRGADDEVPVGEVIAYIEKG